MSKVDRESVDSISRLIEIINALGSPGANPVSIILTGLLADSIERLSTSITRHLKPDGESNCFTVVP